MDTKESPNETLTTKRIQNAFKNFNTISANVINPKFEHLDTWLNKTSISFKKENSQKIHSLFPRFEYGTIIKVDFGINIGSEISGPHFGIVLDRYDSTKNSVVTVLPLTSKSKKFNLPLNELIVDEFTKRLTKQIDVMIDEINKLTHSSTKKTTSLKKIKEYEKEIKIVQNMVDFYSNYAKNSYACLNLITTISKEKIMKPKNKYDIIGRAKCNQKTMKYISLAIINQITNIKPVDINNT